MADEDLEVDIDDLTRRMEGAMTNLRTEFASLRTGRASAMPRTRARTGSG